MSACPRVSSLLYAAQQLAIAPWQILLQRDYCSTILDQMLINNNY